jgi:hypothetical protein
MQTVKFNLSNKINYYIDEAVKEARKSPMINKYGALLIHRGKIISRGYNYDTHIHTQKKYSVLCA